MRKRNYDCIVLKLKRHNVKEKTKYELKGVTTYRGLTKELACYYVYRASYRYLCVKHKEPCNFSESKAIVGWDRCGNDVVFCVAQKRYVSRKRNNDPICIFPEVDRFSLEIDRFMNDRINYFIELMEKQKNHEDLSIECCNIWAPENLIPKGYEHIKTGKVMDGDYYWESYHDYCWQSVGVSFSRFKPGTDIKEEGICYKHGKSGKEPEDEIVNFYRPFIIRKKK